ncbi:caspase family protein [Sphaerisporangium sp. NPDC051017]|uniref:caspase family protein n=1 Tax=Sphaerisporangium sp. NPDC051017 TaxID=3154636 RepID=UPI00341E67B3
MGRRFALLIATYAYDDPGLRRLTAPAHDAEALAAVLRDPEIGGFEVTTLVNEPNQRVGEAIGDFYRDRRGDDLTLLYFTGHGLKDDDGRLHLATRNTRRDSLIFTAISGEQIDYAMERCASRRKVLILDCCYSGAYPGGRLTKDGGEVHALDHFRGRGRTVLTASDATQYAFEGDMLHGNAPQSVFTRHLVEGLRTGRADLDGDGDITLDELYGYVYDRVVAEMPKQRPKRQDNVEGRTVIARNVNWSLPPHIGHALSSPIARDRLNVLDALDHFHRIGNGMVRARVHEELVRLVDDDSRMVSAAAAARLRAIGPEPSEPEANAESQISAATAPAASASVGVEESTDSAGAHDPADSARVKKPQGTPPVEPPESPPHREPSESSRADSLIVSETFKRSPGRRRRLVDRPDKLVASHHVQRGHAAGAGGTLPFPVLGEPAGMPVEHDRAASPAPPPPPADRPGFGQTTAGRSALALNVLFGVAMLIVLIMSIANPDSPAYNAAEMIAEVSRSLWLVAIAAAFAGLVPGRGDTSREQRALFLPGMAGLLIAELAAAFAGLVPGRGDTSRGQPVLLLLGIAGLLIAGLLGLLTTGSDLWWNLHAAVGGVPLLVLAAAAWRTSVRPVWVVVSVAILPLTWLVGVGYALLGLPELVVYVGLNRVARTSES